MTKEELQIKYPIGTDIDVFIIDISTQVETLEKQVAAIIAYIKNVCPLPQEQTYDITPDLMRWIND